MRRRRILLGAFGGATLLVAGWAVLVGGAASDHGPPAAVEPAEQLFSLSQWPVTAEVRRGRVVYEQHCIGCHGDDGQGDGAAAEWLDPPPRNFQRARFKFRSTWTGQLPFEDDVYRTVTCGLPGSAMPGFPLLAEQQRRDVVSYVLDLAVFTRAKVIATVKINTGETTREEVVSTLPKLRAEAVAAALGDRKRIVPPEFPASTPASVAAGRVAYMKVCASCHGSEGRGDGPSSLALRDWQDAAIVPRDFTTGVFRAGSTPADLFLRIRGGLNGTPMPGTSDPDETVWAVIHYMQSVQTTDQIPVTRRMGCNHGSDR
jgi:cytochrome c oxidase cbb3-type subunit 2